MSRDIDLINDLLGQGREHEWLEFKHNNSTPKDIGKYCSALSNGARLYDQDKGYCIWGVDDATRKIVETQFDPFSTRVGNDPLKFWLSNNLNPQVVVNFKEIDHPDGRVVLMEVGAAMGTPTCFQNIPYIRIGDATPKLTDHPSHLMELQKKLLAFSWEEGIAMSNISGKDVFSLLDYRKYFELLKENPPQNESDVLEKLCAEKLIKHDVGDRWEITNLGAILFANDLNSFNSSLSRKGVRLTVYKGKTKTSPVMRKDGVKGYAVGLENMIAAINQFMPINEYVGEVLRDDVPLFPPIAVRELVVNALIHQDFTIAGASPQVEMFEDRIEIANPGKPLVDTDRMMDLPPRSRNERLAALMRRMRFCEESGRGIDRVIEVIEAFQSPPPLFKDSSGGLQVILYGPRSYAQMTVNERIRACYQHACIKCVSGEKIKNETLRRRLGIAKKNAGQASHIIAQAKKADLIKPADFKRPRSGYIPWWG